MSYKNMKKDGLKSLVFDFEPKKCPEGVYMPYCSMGWHRGLILDEDVCKKRKCRDYHRLFIERYKEKIYSPKPDLPFED